MTREPQWYCRRKAFSWQASFFCFCFDLIVEEADGRAATFAAEQEAFVNLHRHVVTGHDFEQLGLKRFAAMGAQGLRELCALGIRAAAFAGFATRHLQTPAGLVVFQFLPKVHPALVHVIHVTLEVGPLPLRKRLQFGPVVKALIAPAREDGVNQTPVAGAVNVGQNRQSPAPD